MKQRTETPPCNFRW